MKTSRLLAAIALLSLLSASAFSASGKHRKLKTHLAGENTACTDIEPMERTDGGEKDRKSCLAAGHCWDPTDDRDPNLGIGAPPLPSCYKPGEKTVRCPKAPSPRCNGSVADNSGQTYANETYDYKGIKCIRSVCVDREKASGNPAACKPKAARDRDDCKKNDMPACNKAGCCWAPLDRGVAGPWCYEAN